jgi:hypothetical protein
LSEANVRADADKAKGDRKEEALAEFAEIAKEATLNRFQEQQTGGVRPYVRENCQMRPSGLFGQSGMSAIDTSHLGLPANPENATIHASSGFIRGTPVEKDNVRCAPAQEWAR